MRGAVQRGNDMAAASGRRWICQSCAYLYDPALGDAAAGIPAGTPFEDLPDEWVCPVCGASKSQFAAMQG